MPGGLGILKSTIGLFHEETSRKSALYNIHPYLTSTCL